LDLVQIFENLSFYSVFLNLIMKTFLFKVFLLLLFSSAVFSQGGTWTWISGSNQTSSPGVFGTQGVPSVNNHPPGMYEPCEFKDKQGNFWLYGGWDGHIHTDFWKYNPLTNEWTWVKGSGLPNQVPVYGLQGVPAPANTPGMRFLTCATWVDTSGNFWLYGGCNRQDDLWKYDLSTNEWTWMKGSTVSNVPAVFGTQGVPAPSNTPGGRNETCSAWTDSLNNLWFFGGLIPGAAQMNDLWKYDISINEWTWINGNTIGSYGVIGVPDPTNIPPRRTSYTRWKDLQGNFWIMGGDGGIGKLNDLWKFDVSTYVWTWLGGSKLADDTGHYQNNCTFDTINYPRARTEHRSAVTDNCGKFWLFGGSPGQVMYLNDLWTFDPQEVKWNWVSGTNDTNYLGNYGIKGVSSVSNMPPSRWGAVAWWGDHKLYLFGGNQNNTQPSYSDLWVFEPDYSCIGPQCDPTGNISIGPNCEGDSTAFDILNTTALLGAQWNFDDPASGVNNTALIVNPKHVFTSAGTYQVQVIRMYISFTDTVIVPVVINPYPVVGLGPDTVFCQGSTFTLHAGAGYDGYLWQDQSTDSVFTASAGGVYYVEATDKGCRSSDTVALGVISCQTPNVGFISSDTTFCDKKCIDFTDLSTNNPSSWQWYFPGAQPASSTLQNPAGICYNQYGTFNVTLIACNIAGCDTLFMPGFISSFSPPLQPVVTQSQDTLYSSPAWSYAWYNTNNPGVVISTDPFYVTGGNGGTFYVVTGDSMGCQISSVLFVATGIASQEIFKPGIRIYPNPTNGLFYLVISDDMKISAADILVTNMLGQLVYETKINGNFVVIDPGELKNGLYFLNLKTADLSVNIKFIIQK